MSYVEEWAAAYEQEHGRPPAELVMRVVQHIEKVGDMLWEQGRKDAQNGEKAYSPEGFPALARKVFHLDLNEKNEAMDEIGDLWWEEYQRGYQEGGAA